MAKDKTQVSTYIASEVWEEVLRRTGGHGQPSKVDFVTEALRNYLSLKPDEDHPRDGDERKAVSLLLSCWRRGEAGDHDLLLSFLGLEDDRLRYQESLRAREGRTPNGPK